MSARLGAVTANDDERIDIFLSEGLQRLEATGLGHKFGTPGAA
jgi:hypothetical protein